MSSIPLQVNTISAQAGVGLRTQHINQILDQQVAVPWFELLVDNWLSNGGLTRRYLDAIAERYPLTLHGVGLSLGGMEPLDFTYLGEIRRLMQHSNALWYSEHLCFSQLQSYYSHDLLPLPYTEESVRHMANRIKQVQDYMGCQMLVENVSSYLEYKQNELSEGEFINAIVEEADCSLLLDVNNFYVNEVNHGQNAEQQIRVLPHHRVKEIHLAGFADKGTHVVDAHNNPVADEVWALYEKTLELVGPVPTLIEWDNDIPSLETLLAERQKAQQYLDRNTQRTSQRTAKGTENKSLSSVHSSGTIQCP